MNYRSTRGKAGTTNFTGTVLAGLAEDGGLYVPEQFPRVTSDELKRFADFKYHHVAQRIFMKLAPDMNASKLWNAVRKVYNPEVFGNVNDGDNADDVVPVRQIGNDLYLARLSNGPTLAFKDLGLQMLGHLFEIVLNGRTMNILGATSGDTGSAAIHAMLGRKGINVFMLSPHQGMSAFQEAQIWGVNDPAIHNLAISGSFDQCQDVVKAVNADATFKTAFNLGAVNSINWARIAAQVVYYFWAYSRVCGVSGKLVDFAVPTGNFGNIYAAYVAKGMGLPVRNLILATNENDVLHEFFATGIYKPRAKTITTSSPSMDITKASNFERYIYNLLGGDAERVAELWDELGRTGRFDLSGMMEAINATGIKSYSVSESEAHSRIRSIHKGTGVIIDTHTAVAMTAALMSMSHEVPIIVMETAQACKFNPTIKQILGIEAPVPAKMEGPMDGGQFFTRMNPDSEMVKVFITERV